MSDPIRIAFAHEFRDVEFSEHDAALRIFELGWRAAMAHQVSPFRREGELSDEEARGD